MENTDEPGYCNRDKQVVRPSCGNYNTSNCSRDCFYARSIGATQNIMERMKNTTITRPDQNAIPHRF